jgi:hypothetical protein
LQQNHEDGKCSAVVVRIVHISRRHKVCHVRHFRCVQCNSLC